MQVERDAVVALLLSLGYKSARKYDDSKLIERLKDLPENMPEDEVDEEHVELFDSIVKEAENDAEFELIDADEEEQEEDEEEESNRKEKKVAKTAKTAKAAKAAKNAKGSNGKAVKGKEKEAKASEASDKKGAKKAAKASANGKVERDKYGAGVSTQSAAINKVFGTKAKDVNQIAKESGIDNVGRVRAHVYHMIKEGHVKKTEKGYVLAK